MIVKADIAPAYKTDHSLPWVEICKDHSERGPVFWRLNISLLQNQEFVNKITEVIENEKDQSFSLAALNWKMIKLSVWGKSNTAQLYLQKR